MNTRILTEASFKKDKHKSLFESSEFFQFNESELAELRTECLKCICSVTHKFCVSHIDSDVDEMETDSDADSCSIDDCSYSSNSVHDSDSDFILSDCELELDDDAGLYGDGHHSEELIHSNDITESESVVSSSSSSIHTKPVGKKAATATYGGTQSDDNSNLRAKDNLLCPGDVIEYRNKANGGIIKMNAIVTIVLTGTERHIILDNGFVLHQGRHWVRKVKMYSTADKSLLPNPYAEWCPLDSCLLQHGSIDDGDDNSDNDKDDKK